MAFLVTAGSLGVAADTDARKGRKHRDDRTTARDAGVRDGAVGISSYVFKDDDYVDSGTTHATFDGTFYNNTKGRIRWWWDDGVGTGTQGVKRGEFLTTTMARPKDGKNPLCIAARVRWQTLTASPTGGLPANVAVTVGVTTTSDGYIRSCRSATGTIKPIYLSGHNYSSRALLRAHADLCHKLGTTSAWVCTTDSNAYGEG